MRKTLRTDRLGEIQMTNSGLKATIIRYGHYEDIDVQFENGTVLEHTQYGHFKRGQLKCPMSIEIIGDYAKCTNNNIIPNCIFLVDADDVRKVKDYLWIKNNNGYISCSKNRLHRMIMDNPKKDIDHINGDKTDNRKSNLRLCTSQENSQNRGKRKHNQSGYKGVHYAPHVKKYIACIRGDGKSRHIGCYDTAEQAALAYNEAALKYHGEFARLNVI